MAAASLPLLRRTICPHCWHPFAPEDVLWISAHADLLGDARLGPEQPQRFLPTRFDLDGNAVDARGFACHGLACPQCHLPMPRAVLETEPVFVSILGTPACGKSYFLTALTWELRQTLPAHFGLSFSDADTVSNRSLNEYEEFLFLNSKADELVPLADLIRKTELQGELYDTVMFGNQSISYPRPFLFSLQPLQGHPSFDPHHSMGAMPTALGAHENADGLMLTQSREHAALKQRSPGRVVCLYDNAGEHFQPGQDSTASPVTQHLARSRLLLFLFDPTQDPRFRKLCESNGRAMNDSGRTSRQEAVLHEAAARVRRYVGLAHHEKHHRPLIVVLTKADVWQHLLDDADLSEPFIQTGTARGLDLERIERMSKQVRQLMQRVCPEIVVAAESFAETVYFVPVSALGQSPSPHPATGYPAIRPRDIRPVWTSVPFLYGLHRCLSGLIPGLRRKHGLGNGKALDGAALRLRALPDLS